MRYTEHIFAGELDDQGVREIIDLLVAQFGLKIFREKTPDYTSYVLAEKDPGE